MRRDFASAGRLAANSIPVASETTNVRRDIMV
jgi:hypothetical protein